MNDKEILKWKIQQKIEQQKIKNTFKDNIAFSECINALGNNTIIFSQDKSKQITNEFESVIPFDNNGNIEWENLKNVYAVKDVEELNLLKGKLNILNERLYVIWDDYEVPVIEADLTNLLEDIDYVEAVEYYFWLFSSKEKIVLEFTEEGTIYIGHN
ncbi:hypothetical protein M3592_27495 [Priestia aryabhattai]|uniref:CDI toxin immunity protein n=1 Tax=Priestia TaxID=2800373 RepID=UPI00203E85E9|nr:hypothetical protein [Priestia aryabhattai]MCM2979144.1 hypothetical protein [Priestia aryabhattai]